MSEPADDGADRADDMTAEAIAEELPGAKVIEMATRRAENEARRREREAKRKADAAPPRPPIFTARQLVDLELPPITWLADQVIPAGMIVLASPPKIGKTWLNLQLAAAVATGSVFAGFAKAQYGKVLFLDLEGGQRREKYRLLKVLAGQIPPDHLHICFDWPRMGQGGLELLEEMILEESYVLIIIDIWNKFRPPRPRNADHYEWDSQVGHEIQQLTRKYPNLSIIVTHHTKKGSVEDHLESISGSNGLPGAADTNIVITRQRGTGQAVLYVTPRDAKEHHLAVEFNEGLWTILGDANEVHGSKRRNQIHGLLSTQKRPMTVKEIADELDDGVRQIRRILSKMVDDATIERDAKGRYRVKAL